jgi:hypothetical protein
LKPAEPNCSICRLTVRISAPIELAFSKLKAFVRARARRTFKSLLRATAQALDSFSAAHCTHFFHHAQYATG